MLGSIQTLVAMPPDVGIGAELDAGSRIPPCSAGALSFWGERHPPTSIPTLDPALAWRNWRRLVRCGMGVFMACFSRVWRVRGVRIVRCLRRAARRISGLTLDVSAHCPLEPGDHGLRQHGPSRDCRDPRHGRPFSRRCRIQSSFEWFGGTNARRPSGAASSGCRW